ncbi:refractory to sigma P [Megachile rotundata]|uniref:refractory to sigma P n=1 Tax=Megachile rotundata TaxID=143995 RepID=UPI003FD22D93
MEHMYKVYVQNNDSTIKEIRRFKTIRNQYNFELFCSKIWELYPELHNGNFIVSWKDLEGDEIVVSTNEEFKLADQMMSQLSISKFYVKILSQNEEPSGTKNEKVVHPGICCDNCNGDVIGYRYKCIQCEDYDLCAQCEAKSLHSQHYMIRMPQPMHAYESQGLVYCLRKFLKKGDMHSNKKHSSNEHSRKKKKCHEFPLNYDILPWLETYMPYLIPFLESKYEPCSTNDAGPSKETPKQKTDKNSKTFVKVYQTDNDGVEFVIEANSDQSKTSTPNNEKVQEDKEDESTSKDTGNKFSGEESKMFDDAKDDKASASDSASITSQDSIAKATAADEWTIVDKNESPEISRASSVLSNLNEGADKQIPSAPTLETNSSQKNIYPRLPEESKIYHSNPIIQTAVETMIKMGFSNQGGLLTYLLEAENGNINKVLDLLQHTNK